MADSTQIYELPSDRGLDQLISFLRTAGYTVIGPKIGTNVIDLGEIQTAQDLPRGVSDEQDKGRYRLKTSEDPRFFGFNLGPKSWKSFLFPEERPLWTARRGEVPADDPEAQAAYPPMAFLGVRACELAAIHIQDRVLCGPGRDPEYTRRRAAILIIGVHCRTAASTCFCPSMGTGPEFGKEGYDLLLTELEDRFVMTAGSVRGAEIITELGLSVAPSAAASAIRTQLEATRAQIVRAMPQEHIKDDIYQSLTSSHWEEVGARCLACANCTMVCPTCFCSTVIDTLEVTGEKATRTHTWDSCFHLDFSYLHGGSHRVSTASRYRQWFSHKLASWQDQFGTSGCVGCGRCITWCPVGIDITEEMATLREKRQSPEGGMG